MNSFLKGLNPKKIFITFTKANVVIGGTGIGYIFADNYYVGANPIESRTMRNINTMAMFYQGVIVGSVIGGTWFISYPTIYYNRKFIRNYLCI